MTTRAPVASTDSAKPAIDSQLGSHGEQYHTAVESAGIACRRREDSIPASVMAPITAARNTLAVGCTTITNVHQCHGGEQHGRPRADQPGGETAPPRTRS